MSKLDNVYEPQEDSHLLLKTTLKYLKTIEPKPDNTPLKICEVGVGSGFVISNIAKKYPNHKYFGTDINPDAIDITKEEFNKLNPETKITLKQINLLENINQKFDLIIFNTPYLPMEKYDKYEELTLKDKAIYGGKKGYEIIDEFILQTKQYLKENGDAIMLFSSQSNLKHVTQTLENNFFEHQILEEESIFFESLYALQYSRTKTLIELEKENITNFTYLTKGKHSKIIKTKYQDKEVIVKIGEPKDIQIEEIFLKKLQQYNFTPKLYLAKNNFVVMEYLKGVQLRTYFEKQRPHKDIIEVFNNILKVTQILDKLGINKFELTNPIKHIFINKDNSVKFIDFERTLYAPNPKNTTQILQFIRRITRDLEKQGIQIDTKKIFEVSKKYKTEPYNVKFEDLLRK